MSTYLEPKSKLTPSHRMIYVKCSGVNIRYKPLAIFDGRKIAALKMTALLRRRRTRGWWRAGQPALTPPYQGGDWTLALN
jgi:hypothetical protein